MPKQKNRKTPSDSTHDPLMKKMKDTSSLIPVLPSLRIITSLRLISSLMVVASLMVMMTAMMVTASDGRLSLLKQWSTLPVGRLDARTSWRDSDEGCDKDKGHDGANAMLVSGLDKGNRYATHNAKIH